MTMVAIIVVSASWLYVVARARWMFTDIQGLALFATGLGLIAGAAIAANPALEDAEAAATPSYGLWHVCLALGVLGTAVVALALGRWWVLERRKGRGERLPPLTSADTGPVRVLQHRIDLAVDWAAIALLPFGGFVPVAGWLMVMLLLWTARLWTPREKMIAAIALPGGPAVAYFAISAIANLSVSQLVKVPLVIILVPLLFVPAGAAIYLAACTRRRSSGAKDMSVV